MDTVVAVYTGRGLSEPLSRQFSQRFPQVRLVNLIDEGLIQDVNASGITVAITRRLFNYFENAEAMGARAILNTCSSIGEVAAQARPFFGIPIIRIDEAMARRAVEQYPRIGVIATLPSTLTPTRCLIEAEARAEQRAVQVIEGLAEGAYQALIHGDGARHDDLIRETATRLAPGVDAIVLAQGSMARMEEALAGITRKPVLSSIGFGLEDLARVL